VPLIECPDCKKQVSDKAISCPSCGHPFKLAESAPADVTGHGIPGATVLFAYGRVCGKVLANSFERIAIRSDFKKRIPRDSHVAINAFPIVQLDDCLTGDKFALRIDDLPFSS
jgi:hypothetical protein